MALNNFGMGFLFTAKDLASGTINKLNGSFNRLDKTSDRAQKSMTKGLGMVAAGLGAVAVGAKGLQILGKTTNDAISFGKAIGEVSTLVDEAAFSTDDMKRITMEMAETYGADALKQAPALYQAISAGATDVKSATALMDATNKFAIAGVTDLESSVDVLSSAVNTYGVETLSASDAADTMFVAIKAGKTTAGELASQLGKVAPTAKAVGVTFQEMNAAIAATTAQGIRTRQSVTGMKAAFANIIKPTADAKKEAKRLGITFTASSLRAKGLSKFLGDVTKSGKFNANSMSKLFGSVQALNFITALTSNSSSKFNEVLGQMDQRTGAATEAFEKMNATVLQQEARQEALKKNIIITIGEALLPLKKIWTDIVGSILAGFKALPGPVQKFLAISAALISTLLIIAGAVTAITGAFIILKAVMLPILIPLLIPLAKIILIIGAIVAAIMLFRKAYQENFLGFKTLVDGVSKAFSKAWGAISDAFGALADALKPIMPALKIIGKVLLVALVAPLVAFFAVLMALLKGLEFVFEGIAFIFSSIASLIRDPIGTIKAAWQNLKEFFGAVAFFFQMVWKKAVSAVADFFGAIFDWIGDKVEWVLKKLRAVVDFAKSVVNSVDDFSSFLVGADTGGVGFSGDPKTLDPDARRQLVAAGKLDKSFLPKEDFGKAAGGAPPAAAPSGSSQGSRPVIEIRNVVEIDGEQVGESTKRVESDNDLRR